MPMAHQVREAARKKQSRGKRGRKKKESTSFNMAILRAILTTIRVAALPDTFENLRDMIGQIRALVITEAAHVVREKLRSTRSRRGLTKASICQRERGKITVEFFQIPSFQEKFKRTSTLFGLIRENNILLPALVQKWNENEGRVVFDVHESTSSSHVQSVTLIPLEILTSYRRMYTCNLNGLMNRSPRLIQALLGRPPSKHTFFIEEDEEEDSKNNGRPRGGSFGEWCALAKNIKRHRIEREKKKNKKTKQKKGEELNESQMNAIKSFLNGDEPLYMIHGPPGTGKTKTIIGMLNMLSSSSSSEDGDEKRIVVCAPSNKAVYVILRSYVLKMKSSSPEQQQQQQPLLVGVEDGLPDDLRKYFVHDAKIHFDRDASNLVRVLSEAANNETSRSTSSLLEDALGFVKDLQSKLMSRCPQTSKSLRRALKRSLEISLETFRYQGGLNDFLKVVELKKVAIKLRDDVRDLNEYDVEREWTSRSRVVFCTLACAGRDMMRRREPCDLLVIDEAAQAVEAECLIAFQLRPKSVIFVGDPNQLSAMAQSDVARRAGYERSTMQRLFEKSSVPCNLLSTQYRMNPEISSFPNSQFYENRIFNSSVVCEKSRRFRFSREKLPIIFKDLRIYHVEDEGEGKCVLSPYNVLNVSQGRERRVGGSYCNANEAEIAATLCHVLLGDKHGKRKRSLSSPRISVITFYNAQVRAIKDKLPYGYDDSDVRVSTVDSFQGSESEVVILSCVRSNSRHAVGFVSEFRRLNVALTRAKLGLIVLCHAPTLENCPSKDLKMLVRNARERGLLHRIATSSNNV